MCRFQPWTPCAGSTCPVESGSGRLSVSIFWCHKTQAGTEAVRPLDLPEETVDVIGPTADASGPR